MEILCAASKSRTCIIRCVCVCTRTFNCSQWNMLAKAYIQTSQIETIWNNIGFDSFSIWKSVFINESACDVNVRSMCLNRHIIIISSIIYYTSCECVNEFTTTQCIIIIGEWCICKTFPLLTVQIKRHVIRFIFLFLRCGFRDLLRFAIISWLYLLVFDAIRFCRERKRTSKWGMHSPCDRSEKFKWTDTCFFLFLPFFSSFLGFIFCNHFIKWLRKGSRSLLNANAFELYTYPCLSFDFFIFRGGFLKRW